MYISTKTLDSSWGLYKFLITPYGECYANLKNAFCTQHEAPKALIDRVKLFVASLFLFIPVINGIALYILSGLTQNINDAKLAEELESLKKKQSTTVEELINAFGYQDILLFKNGTVTGNERLIVIGEKNSEGKAYPQKTLDFNLSKLMIFSDRLFQIGKKSHKPELLHSAWTIARAGGSVYGNGDASSIQDHIALLEKHVTLDFKSIALNTYFDSHDYLHDYLSNTPGMNTKRAS